MITTLYIIGAIITLIFYASGQGQRLYENSKLQRPFTSDSIIKLSVRISILFYVLLWFIFMPWLLITNSFEK